MPGAAAAIAAAITAIATLVTAMPSRESTVAAAALAFEAAAAVRHRRRIHLHRGGDLLLDGHVAHRNRRRGAWLHVLRVGLPHADRLFVGTRL